MSCTNERSPEISYDYRQLSPLGLVNAVKSRGYRIVETVDGGPAIEPIPRLDMPQDLVEAVVEKWSAVRVALKLEAREKPIESLIGRGDHR